MIRIGKIVATHGLSGTLILTHIAGKNDWLHMDEAIFIAVQKDSRIPYYPTKVKRINDEEYHVQLDEVDSVEVAKKLIGKEIFVAPEVLGNATVDSPLLWVGFNVVDAHQGALGPLVDAVQTGPQWIGTIHYEGKEVLIPLVKPIIVEVNLRNRFLRLDLPDGILDL